MKKKWKLIFGIILAVAVVAIVIAQYSRGIDAETLEISPRTFVKAFEEEGIVVSQGERRVHAAYGGKILSLPVAEGQAVEVGELLISFDESELTFQIAQLEAQVKSLTAQYKLEKSQVSLEDLRKLYEAGAISSKEYEDAANRVNSEYYPGQIEALQAQLGLLRYQSGESKITAPAAGTVANLEVKPGMVAQPGQYLLTILPEGDYGAEVYVLTEDAAVLWSGMQVELIQDNKELDIIFPGEVEKIAPAAVEKTSALGLVEQRLKVSIQPQIPAGLTLRPGYALNVRFTIQERENALIVPKTALFPYESGDALWVAIDGKARIRAVKTGLENDREVIIEEGLTAGEKIILNPQLEGLKENAKVNSI
ncbi:MAG: efflux RND transporter periplasmic adaptor subunit [Clostridia bacterium]|jgi:HlyD family secretion protein|nr:efflux RND transporter periplasmic adaptor subunit [Clostridia bacterium]